MTHRNMSEELKEDLQEPLKVPVGKQSSIAPPPGLDTVQPAKVPLGSEGAFDSSSLSPRDPKNSAVPPPEIPEGQFMATGLANQSAALALENIRLHHELMLMWYQSQSMASMSYAPPGYNGYAYAPWVSPSQPVAHKASKKSTTKQTARKPRQEEPKAAGNDIETASTASGEESWSLPRSPFSSGVMETGSDEEHDAMGVAKSSQQLRTTVMLRNVPNTVTTEELLQLMNDEGFEGSYNLVYLPMDFKTKVGLGYAFVDLKSVHEAEALFKRFHGFTKWSVPTDKICEVAWSALQGLEEHIERYRNSPVMHESVPDDFRPVLFNDKGRIPFPPPTKRIRAPRQWSRRH